MARIAGPALFPQPTPISGIRYLDSLPPNARSESLKRFPNVCLSYCTVLNTRAVACSTDHTLLIAKSANE